MRRTAPIEAVPGQAAPSGKSNPFGDAKPITEEEREKRFLAAKVRRKCDSLLLCKPVMMLEIFGRLNLILWNPLSNPTPPPSLLNRVQAEREKALGAAPAAAKDEVPAPRREAPGPRRDDGRKEGSAFQSRKEGSRCSSAHFSIAIVCINRVVATARLMAHGSAVLSR